MWQCGKKASCLACAFVLLASFAFSQDATLSDPPMTSEQLLSESISLAETLQAKMQYLRIQLAESQDALIRSESKLNSLTEQYQTLAAQYQALVQTSDQLRQASTELSKQWTTLTSLYQDYLTAFANYKQASERKIKDLEALNVLLVVFVIVGTGAGIVGGALAF